MKSYVICLDITDILLYALKLFYVCQGFWYGDFDCNIVEVLFKGCDILMNERNCAKLLGLA